MRIEGEVTAARGGMPVLRRELGTPTVRLLAAVAPIAALTVLWVLAVAQQGQLTERADGKDFAVDVAMYVTAARLTAQGGNPFDPGALYRTEHAWLQQQGLAITRHSAMVRVGYPPLFFWAMEPLSHLPFNTLAYAWRIGMYLLAALGFLACLTYLGWQRRTVPVLLFLLMPPVILGCGNTTNLIFAAVGCSLALSRRHPAAAGALLVVAWIKPPVTLPLVLLVILFHSPARRSLSLGFSGASAALLGLTLLTTGARSLHLWFLGLTTYSRDITIQQEMPSLSGLYIMWASPTLRLIFTALLLAGVAGLTATWWWKHGRDAWKAPHCAAWLWFAWFVATPYVHFADEVLLALPLLAVADHNASGLTRRWALLALYLVFLSPVLIGWTPFRLQLLGLMLAPAGYAAYRAGQSISVNRQRAGQPTAAG